LYFSLLFSLIKIPERTLIAIDKNVKFLLINILVVCYFDII